MFYRCACYFVFATVTTAALAAVDFDREMILTPARGVSPEDGEIRRWQERAGAAQASRADYERLGWAFVAKARRTLDAGFYALAEKTADVLDARFGVDSDSRLLRGHVDHNLHRFGAAEEIARQLVAERGGPDDYALLADALMEQGKLGPAVDALQRLANLKPGVEADSRIAHVRWLRGDLTGAIAAMERAVREADPRDDGTVAWLLTRLAGFELQAGHLARAGALATAAIRHAPDYPAALLALGRVRCAAGDPGTALDPLRQAARLNPIPEYQWWLADVLRANDRADEAAEVERQLLARGALADPRTLALFLATRDRDAAGAVRLARAELATRQDVFTHDAAGWALATAGDWPAAAAELRLALAEHTRDARLFLHAAVIAQATGDLAAAARYVAAARDSRWTLTPGELSRLEKLRNAVALAAGGGAPVGAPANEPRCDGQQY